MITEFSKKISKINKRAWTQDELTILYEDLDEVILQRMPYWFKSLREAYKKKACVILL